MLTYLSSPNHRKLSSEIHSIFTYTSTSWLLHKNGARGSIDGWGAMLQAISLLVRTPIVSLTIFNLPDPSKRIIATGVYSAFNWNE
jgi:hypothetical protein